MRDSRGLLILLVVVVVLAAAVWWWTRPRPEPPSRQPTRQEPIRFHHTEVAVRSPDLSVGDAEIHGAIHPDYTSWQVSMPCDEPEGCAGEFAVEVRYDAGAGSGRLVLLGRGDVPSGGRLRFEGLQDPPTAVDGVDRVTLEVRSRGRAGAEVEIPL
jgi:hypothetical protein